MQLVTKKMPDLNFLLGPPIILSLVLFLPWTHHQTHQKHCLLFSLLIVHIVPELKKGVCVYLNLNLAPL